MSVFTPRRLFAAITLSLFVTPAVRADDDPIRSPSDQPPVIRSPSDAPPPVDRSPMADTPMLDPNVDVLSESFATGNEVRYTSHHCLANLCDALRADVYSFGGKFIAPTTTGPGINDFGGGVTFGAEWGPCREFSHRGRVVQLSPIVNADLLAVGFKPQTQLNQLGGQNMIADGLFMAVIQPGVRLRTTLCDDANLFVQAGLDVRYSAADLRQVNFVSIYNQVPVQNFTSRDWSTGYFVGGGVEFPWHGHVVRTAINFESYRTDIYTGVSRQESQIGIVTELLFSHR